MLHFLCLLVLDKIWFGLFLELSIVQHSDGFLYFMLVQDLRCFFVVANWFIVLMQDWFIVVKSIFIKMITEM